MPKTRIALIRGDGIGPEVIDSTEEILSNLDLNLEFTHFEAGYKHMKKTGIQIEDETIEEIGRMDACLKGPTQTAFGTKTQRGVAPTIREKLDLYANLRPIKARKGVRCIFPDTDLLIVRENTEGLYKGLEFKSGETAFGVRVITESGSERIARFAFNLARKEERRKVTAIHKANVLKETCGLFLNTCRRIAEEYPEIEFQDAIVDATALKLITKPKEFDVILTTNLFGDILSDECAGLIGGLGMTPSANIGDRTALFEPVHGSAPDIAGKKIANPSATILSSVLMLEYLGEIKQAKKLETALNQVLAEGRTVTPDIGGNAKTHEFTKAVLEKLHS